jgi:hypothetical protein
MQVTGSMRDNGVETEKEFEWISQATALPSELLPLALLMLLRCLAAPAPRTPGHLRRLWPTLLFFPRASCATR